MSEHQHHPRPTGRGLHAASPRDRDRRSRPGGIAATLVLVALGIAAVVGLDQRMAPEQPDVLLVEDRPSPGFDLAAEPLGTPPRAPSRGGPHEFVAVQDDGETPVAYDPCRPIHYVVRPEHAPPGSRGVLHEAIARVEEATGLRFVHDGPTGEDPGAGREPFQPDRYGDRWAPVLIAWVSTAENHDFATDVAGQAGSVALTAPGEPRVFVTGTVELDAELFAELLSRPGGRLPARSIVLHELGHLVGLDHVDDPRQLMYPTDVGALGFGPGDLTGLAALGRGACVPEL